MPVSSPVSSPVLTHHHQPCIAAIDGGGTKTLLAVVGRDGSLGPVLRGAGSNPFDQAGWQDVLQSLLRQLPSTTAALSLGLAGYEETRVLGREQSDVVGNAFAGPFNICSDVEMACTGA
ncbi:hypothetical protein JK213_00005, partial [Gluconobacter sp. Dm-44]|nr:hypothetical protein [Gluconobacter sp. Dm-44]